MTLAVSFQGCSLDVEPTDNFTIGVAPKSVSLTLNDSQEFVASGGLTYTWSLEGAEDDARWAFLSATTGDRVTYTSVKEPDDNTPVIRVLKVTSTFGGDTNSGELIASAEAYVSHIRAHPIADTNSAAD